MSVVRSAAIVAFAAVLFAGCAGQPETQPNASADTSDDGFQLLVSKPAPANNTVCLQTYLHTTKGGVREQATKFFVTSLKRAGFHNVLVDANPAAAKKCLTAMLRTTRESETKQSFQISIVDPSTKSVVFDAVNRTVVWISYPKELYNPVFDALAAWKKGGS